VRWWIRSLRCDRLAKDQPAEMKMFQISEVLESPALNVWRSFLPLPGLIESESIVDESQRNENRRFQGLTGDSSAPVSPKPWKELLESAVAVPWKRDFSSMIAAIMSLPLTDDEKAEVVRRLLAQIAT
jgi:hypothetical protein